MINTNNDMTLEQYDLFLKSKIKLAPKDGFEIEDEECSPYLKPHNRLMVKWMVAGGCRACFAAFGLHKSVTQLEVVRITLSKVGGMGLIICPLNIRQEFIKDAVNILKWETPPKFIRSIAETNGSGIYLTNYETVRDGKLDPRMFSCASLDEASVLRGFGGSKTFREFMRLFTGDEGPNGNRNTGEMVPYRFVATATPSPNDYIELLAYADFLGIMDISQAKTRFFKRDSTKADVLTLYPHKEEEFWLWVASWGIFLQKPSDITGDVRDDEGYILPEIDVNWHEVKSGNTQFEEGKDGQLKISDYNSLDLQQAARVKRESINVRLNKVMELRAEDPSANRIIWHDLEDERKALERSIKGLATVYGSQKIEDRELIISEFSNGKIQEIAGKPVMLGSGCNLQRHCHWAIYMGIGFKFNDFIQSVHRIQRFLQVNKVRIDLIYTDQEYGVRKVLENKWVQHKKLVKNMTEIIRKYGLNHVEMARHLTRSMGVKRVAVKGERFEIFNNDNVIETKNMESDSIGLILSSWPFTNQYEYSPNYADFGHSDNPVEFFKQMDFLTPETYRVLMPGRIYAVHVKDRIVTGGLNGLGFQTVYPFHIDCIQHMIKHGFGYMGMKTIVTDVVRENNQTYRLGWTEQCKDGSKMGVGMPEYLLYFRKPPSDNSDGYADVPVLKAKKEWDKSSQKWINTDGYSRARWQVDAHGYARSNGDRLLSSAELAKMEHDKIYQTFKTWTEESVYNFESHVQIAEELELKGKLPNGFMLLQPSSWSDEVWTDITRMLTLNGNQYSKGKELHICPMQFDIADRVITQMSNPGDKVYDPFGGLMTTPYRAILKDRIGIGCELSAQYFLDGAAYCKSAELKVNTPTLFDSLEKEAVA